MCAVDRDPGEYFAARYSAAHDAFLRRARTAGAEVRSHAVDARGPQGEELVIASAYLGPERPTSLLVVSSGVHGVEGFAGSAVQQRFLAACDRSVSAGAVGVLLVHALDPYGFAHLRRANENNVDLNRNALDRFPGPQNRGYTALNDWLNPTTPPDGIDDFALRGFWYLLIRGRTAVRQAIAGGQYDHPRGLFYGGSERQQSLHVFARILADPRLSAVEKVMHVDLHTGLGAYGGYKLLVEDSPGSPALAVLQRWFGSDAVASNHDPAAGAYAVNGVLGRLTVGAFPGARAHPMVLEFGTYGPARVLAALRAENRVHFYEPDAARRTRVKRQLLEIFCPADRRWRAAVLEHGHRVAMQALEALRAAGRA